MYFDVLQLALFDKLTGTFQYGDKYTVFMHRREETIVDVWLESRPEQVETLIVPEDFAVMNVIASKGVLTSVPQGENV